MISHPWYLVSPSMQMDSKSALRWVGHEMLHCSHGWANIPANHFGRTMLITSFAFAISLS